MSRFACLLLTLAFLAIQNTYADNRALRKRQLYNLEEQLEESDLSQAWHVARRELGTGYSHHESSPNSGKGGKSTKASGKGGHSGKGHDSGKGGKSAKASGKGHDSGKGKGGKSAKASGKGHDSGKGKGGKSAKASGKGHDSGKDKEHDGSSRGRGDHSDDSHVRKSVKAPKKEKKVKSEGEKTMKRYRVPDVIESMDFEALDHLYDGDLSMSMSMSMSIDYRFLF